MARPAMADSTGAVDRADVHPGGRGRALAGLSLDVGLPLAGYYTLHALGASDWTALLIATAAAGARLVVVAAWTRRVSWFAAVMLAVFGVGLGLSLLGGDPRLLLLKDSASTAALGLVFLASLLGDHPLTLAGAENWRPAQAPTLGRLYRDEPGVRRAFRISALGWAVGLLTEAAVRIPFVYLLPLPAAVGVSTALMIGALVAVAVWNGIYVTRAARDTPALSMLLPGGLAPPRGATRRTSTATARRQIHGGVSHGDVSDGGGSDEPEPEPGPADRRATDRRSSSTS